MQDDLFKEASEVDSVFGAKTSVVVFGSDGKVCSNGDVDSVFDLFVSGMNGDGDGDDDDEVDGIEKFCTEYESAIVELGKKVEAVKDAEEKKKVMKKMREYESAIVELREKVEAEIKRSREVEERESNGGGFCLVD